MNRALCLASVDADVNESKIEDVLAKVTLIHKKQQEEVIYIHSASCMYIIY
jgi:hypothetical protein